MKVVINRCYGGFGLSPEATLELWKRGGPVEATPVADYYGERLESDETSLGFKRALADWRAYLAEPGGKSTLFLTVFSPDESLVLNARESDRSDPKLVALVEEMGEKANGRCSSLSIVRIPDGVDYEIAEYDGFEHVAEKHRTWS
jgi:hypothetical protein